MPDISRRGFLRGLLTVAGAAVVAPAALAQAHTPFDPDRVRWERGEGRIWQVRGPRNRAQIISDMLSSPQGRQRLAESMTQSIHERLHYEAISRQVFLVEQLPDGPLPTVDAGLIVPNDIGDSIERWHDRMSRP